MGNHQSSDQMKNDLEIMLSKINALEIIAGDEFQKGTVKVLREIGRAHV